MQTFIIHWQKEMSPLHFATSRGHSDIVTTLIEHGAQLDVVNFVSCPNILPVNVKPLMINELLISIKRKKCLIIAEFQLY